MHKIDLHTHSVRSPDGSLAARDYALMIEQGRLDTIAVTDHDTIDFAHQLHQELGECIIIGEEISTQQGDLIGLYLTDAVPAGLHVWEAAEAIKKQGGLVYVPHPFETIRKGIPVAALRTIGELVDIVEVYNGRAMFQNRSEQAGRWAAEHGKAPSAASDAHGRHGWGRTFAVLAEQPSKHTLVALLNESASRLQRGSVGLQGISYPKINRLRKRLGA